MWNEFFAFDLRYMLRQPLPWILLVMFGGLAFAFFMLPPIFLTVTGASTLAAPSTQGFFLGMLTILGSFAFSGMLASNVLRDFEAKAMDLLLVNPVSVRSYLTGRILAGLVCAGVIFGVAALGLMIAAKITGPSAPAVVILTGGVFSFALVALPNLFFMSAFSVTLACKTRSVASVYGGVLLLYLMYMMSVFPMLGLSEDNQFWLAGLLDPYGTRALSYAGLGQTAAFLDTHLPILGPRGILFFLNRALWVSIGLGLCVWTAIKFRPLEAKVARKQSSKKSKKAEVAPPVVGIHAFRPVTFSLLTPLRQIGQFVLFDTKSLWRTSAFRIMLGLTLVALVVAMLQVDGIYGSRAFLTTARMIVALQDSFPMPMMVLAIAMTADLLLKDEAAHFSGIANALPVSPLVRLLAHWLALVSTLGLYILGVVVLAWSCSPGEDFAPWGVVAKTELTSAALMVSLAIAIQSLCKNRFTSYLVFIAVVAAGKAAALFNPDLAMWGYATMPLSGFSDLSGFGDSMTEWANAALAWSGVAAVLLTTVFILSQRLKRDGGSWKGQRAFGPLAAGVVLAAYAGAVLIILPKSEDSTGALQARQAQYERNYKQYEGAPQLRVRGIDSTVDLFPSSGRATVKSEYLLVNASETPIQRIYLTVNPRALPVVTGLPAHRVVLNDNATGFRILELATPVAPHESIPLQFVTEIEESRFNSLDGESIMANGTFFNNQQYFPQLGYLTRDELTDPEDRRKQHLPAQKPLARAAAANRGENQLEGQADWVALHTVISTEPDQIALTSGELVKSWKVANRAYFEYRTPHDVLPYFGIASARYSVRKVKSGHVTFEAYFDAKHERNVNQLIDFTRRTVEFYEKTLGEYPASTMKLVEISSPLNIAQSLPGMLVLSDSSEFTRDSESAKPNPLLFLAAHEVGHQWWANQVVGANALGANVVTETLAQYGALRVIQKYEGKDGYAKALRYDEGLYQHSKKQETEPSLIDTTKNFMAYHKGALVFDKLTQSLGAPAVQSALKNFYDKYRFSQAGYPTAIDLQQSLCEATSEESCKEVHRLMAVGHIPATLTVLASSKTETTAK